MTEHQLDRAHVDSVRQQPTRAFVTEVVPVQIDLAQLRTINASTRFRALGVVTIREEQQRLPSGLGTDGTFLVAPTTTENVRTELKKQAGKRIVVEGVVPAAKDNPSGAMEIKDVKPTAK